MTPRARGGRSDPAPTLAVERSLWAAGTEVVVGVDEVGRGAWAGPLTVGMAVLPTDRRVYKVRDSKALAESERERLYDRVAAWCRAWSVGHAWPEECDALGMGDAQRLAARRALEGLGVVPDGVLIDGRWDFVSGVGATADPGTGAVAEAAGTVRRIVKGDARCLSIATASILAKVTRDRLMRGEDEHFPGYDFHRNKGYPCPRHKMALRAFGPTSIHRRSWVFMENLCWGRALRHPGPGGSAVGASA
ncbi:MAG TPA: ribonuclease HII, partial [Acidimicrobiales bacterium]|nr:ribonuclease HII [Acidimicrobiales bacterium]